MEKQHTIIPVNFLKKMKIKLENLNEETTLEKFVEDWDLDINEINESLENNSYYSDDFVEIVKEENITTISILTKLWEVIDVVNNIYNNHYLFVIKDVYYGENDEDGELNYTSFSIENSIPEINDIVFKGGEYEQKSILNKNQLSKFYEQVDNGDINWSDLLKYQEIWFVKKKDLISNGWGKTIESFNLYDWELYPPEIISDGLRESFFKNGNISKSGEYKDSKRNGVWKEFNIDGHLISEIYYLNGEKEGESISYYENGNKKEKSNFKRDRLHGKKIEWNENGDIERETIYKDNVLVTYIQFENGKLSFEGEMIEGKLDGPFKSFYESGKVLNEGRMKKNKQHGEWKGYYKNGKIEWEGRMEENEKDGEWKGYYESGNIRRIGIFNNGVILSQQCWDENGNKINCE